MCFCITCDVIVAMRCITSVIGDVILQGGLLTGYCYWFWFEGLCCRNWWVIDGAVHLVRAGHNVTEGEITIN